MSKKRTSLDAIMSKVVEDAAPPPAPPVPSAREAPPADEHEAEVEGIERFRPFR